MSFLCRIVTPVEKVVLAGTKDEGPICISPGVVVYLAAICPVEGVGFPTDSPTWTIESQPTRADALLISASGGSAVVEIDYVTVESGANQDAVLGAKNWATV